ncbi:hypothetical protein [Bacillus mycoides]|uniref:hypothetical protein n=1 Tax=Bacillus mycoides TaxID=1405 RepID=UPI002DFF1CDD|nr:hypothetical protein [Bacillus mycoides]MEC5263057.1 hypothetical protein [Bacillus mycoides]HDR7257902.1 hypothetical protein [Bacillus paranthracis]
MNFFINKFSILSKTLNKSFSETFDKGINLIIGEKDSGKTSLARAIMFTLGCDVCNFNLKRKLPDIIFILEFSLDDQDYTLIRKQLNTTGRGKNYFKLIYNDKEEVFFDTKTFTERLNDLFKINIIMLDKNNERTYLYPNHIFLPFFIDQDYSWQNYLASTFTGLNFIYNYRKIILEYYSGMRSNQYYELLLKKNETKKEYQKLESLVDSKELIYQENINNMKIIEDVDIEKFKEKYQTVLKIYDNIIKTEHQLKNKFNELSYEKNSLIKQHERLSLTIETIIPDELEEHCPNCKQIIYKKLDENYKLLTSKENLINEREKIQLQLKDIEEEIFSTNKQISEINIKGTKIETKLNADENLISLAERAESYAFSKINDNLHQEIDNLIINKEIKKEELETIESQLNELNHNNITGKYQKLMIEAYKDLNIEFSYKNYYTSNLESVNINLSGASKVQAFIAQYLSILELVLINSKSVHIPMFIDTYLKDDFNQDEINRTTDFVFKKLNEGHQAFLYISNNRDTLSRIENYDYNYKKIELESEKQLFKEDYMTVYSEYKKFLE